MSAALDAGSNPTPFSLPMTIIDFDELRNASLQELENEYERLRQKLTGDGSAVKTEQDLAASTAMRAVKKFLVDLHGVPERKLYRLDNPDESRL